MRSLRGGGVVIILSRLTSSARYFSTKLFVGGLSYDSNETVVRDAFGQYGQIIEGLSSYITNQEFRDMFTPFGVVKAARLIRDPKTQKPKGFGFVEFESEESAQKALKAMNGRMVNGGLVFVEVAEKAKAGGD